jgi:type IV fimbrial biogenesis protein FimT
MDALHAARPRGLTVIELMVVIALVGILVALVAPSMRGLISAQRVRGINAELVTDLQYARSEAARRSHDVRVGFKETDSLTCYVVYIEPEVVSTVIIDADGGASRCDCSRAPGQAVCTAEDGREEIKTVQVQRSTGVTISVTSAVGPIINFGRSSGRLEKVSEGGSAPIVPFEVLVAGTARGQLRTSVNPAGRPSVCSPDSSISGVQPCS